MTFNLWRPFGQSDEAKLHDTLRDGVPSALAKSLSAWQQDALAAGSDRGQSSLHVLHKVERDLDVTIESPERVGSQWTTKAIISHFQAIDGELILTDYLLSAIPIDELGGPEQLQVELANTGDMLGQLESVLKDSRSKWTIGVRAAGRLGLVQRVPEGVQTAVGGTIRSSRHAGIRLGEAWSAAFGIAPDPSRAYSLAVKAVEDAAIPVVSPKDSTATLGKINGQMKAAGDWSLPLQRDDPDATTSATLLSMMKMLWAGQADRHGGQHDPSLVITQEAAEVAVMTAATLVQWFTSGAVARR